MIRSKPSTPQSSVAPTELYALNHLSRRSHGEGGLTLRSLNYFLKLLTDYRSVEAIDCDTCHADSLAMP